MLIRGNQFDEFTPPVKISKINMKHALARLSASVSRRIKAHLSTYGGRSNMSDPSMSTQFIPYELLLHTLNSINVCATEKPSHTTGVFKFRVHKGNIKGLKSIRAPKLTRQPLHKPKHCQSSSNHNINMPIKRPSCCPLLLPNH
jgi:hypothetical protein